MCGTRCFIDNSPHVPPLISAYHSVVPLFAHAWWMRRGASRTARHGTTRHGTGRDRAGWDETGRDGTHARCIPGAVRGQVPNSNGEGSSRCWRELTRAYVISSVCQALANSVRKALGTWFLGVGLRHNFNFHSECDLREIAYANRPAFVCHSYKSITKM